MVGYDQPLMGLSKAGLSYGLTHATASMVYGSWFTVSGLRPAIPLHSVPCTLPPSPSSTPLSIHPLALKRHAKSFLPTHHLPPFVLVP